MEKMDAIEKMFKELIFGVSVLKIEIGERFDSVDKQLGLIDEKLDGIGGQFEQLTEQRIEVSEDVSYIRDIYKLKRN
ncbi:MAG: hypothetical protein IMZ40_00935 [Bacilli bacterium]|nr:hypothetical protein [Bacilli bacterium]